MEATPFLLLALNFMSLCIRPGHAFAIDPIHNTTEKSKALALEIITALSINDTATEFLIVDPLESNATFESVENRTGVILNPLPNAEYLPPCNPEHKPSGCRDHLLEKCRSINGSYRCACPENVSRTENGTCTVFNECIDRKHHNCSSFATCVDLPNGYTCVCKDGYRDAAEVETTLPGRVCISLQWVLQGSKKTKPSLSTEAQNTTTELPSTSDPFGPPGTNPNTTVPPDDDAPESNETGNDTAPTADFITGSISNAVRADSPILVGTKPNKSILPNEMRSSNSSNGSFTLLPLLVSTQNVNERRAKAFKIGDKHVPSPSKVNLAEPLSGNTLRDVFTAFDADGDERISFQELKNAVEQYGIKLQDNDIQAMIKVADFSGEGLVDFGEFSSLMKRAF